MSEAEQQRQALLPEMAEVLRERAAKNGRHPVDGGTATHSQPYIGFVFSTQSA